MTSKNNRLKYEKKNLTQLKRLNEGIQPPTVNELVKAIKNTISKKAMADDNML